MINTNNPHNVIIIEWDVGRRALVHCGARQRKTIGIKYRRLLRSQRFPWNCTSNNFYFLERLVVCDKRDIQPGCNSKRWVRDENVE